MILDGSEPVQPFKIKRPKPFSSNNIHIWWLAHSNSPKKYNNSSQHLKWREKMPIKIRHQDNMTHQISDELAQMRETPGFGNYKQQTDENSTNLSNIICYYFTVSDRLFYFTSDLLRDEL